MSDLLPPNAAPLERAVADVLAKIDTLPLPLRDLWRPQTCPVELLPWLAWTLSVDHWDATWSTAVKRQVIAESIELHRHKGTPWAVERALVVAGSPNATVEEWYEYGGAPYHFRVTVDIEGETVSAATEARMLRSIERHKNVRSWLDTLDYVFSVASPVPVLAIGMQTSEIITVSGAESGGYPYPD